MTDKEIAELMVCRLKGHRLTKTKKRYCDTCFQLFLESQPMSTPYIVSKRKFLSD